MSVPLDDGFELFQRAIVGRDHTAWAQLHARYRLLLIAWARQSSIRLAISEHYEDVADQAFAKAWAALTPQRFGEFPSLPALLGYLRSCVSTVLIDLARSQSARERVIQKLPVGMPPTPEHLVLDQLENSLLWKLVHALIETPQEQKILYQNIVLGVPPRVLLIRHPELFGSIDEIYAAKRNLTGRLQRNRDLKHLMREIQDN